MSIKLRIIILFFIFNNVIANSSTTEKNIEKLKQIFQNKNYYVLSSEEVQYIKQKEYFKFNKFRFNPIEINITEKYLNLNMSGGPTPITFTDYKIDYNDNTFKIKGRELDVVGKLSKEIKSIEIDFNSDFGMITKDKKVKYFYYDENDDLKSKIIKSYKDYFYQRYKGYKSDTIQLLKNSVVYNKKKYVDYLIYPVINFSSNKRMDDKYFVIFLFSLANDIELKILVNQNSTELKMIKNKSIFFLFGTFWFKEH